MQKFSRHFLLIVFFATCCELTVVAQQLPTSQIPVTAPNNSAAAESDATSKWILLRNMQVIQAKTRPAGERIALIMDNGGAEMTLPVSEVIFQGESLDAIAKFRLSGIDPSNVSSQVEFVEWAIRYELNGIAKLQLNELIAKYPKSPKLQLLTRRIESNELMKQQQAIAAATPAPVVAKAAFVAPVPQVEKKTELHTKTALAKNTGRGNTTPKTTLPAKKIANSASAPKTLPSIAVPNPIAGPPSNVASGNTATSEMLSMQRKTRNQNLIPEGASDPFDPEVFNRMHAKSPVPQETATPPESGTIIRR
jgi:hypothetical protein